MSDYIDDIDEDEDDEMLACPFCNIDYAATDDPDCLPSCTHFIARTLNVENGALVPAWSGELTDVDELLSSLDHDGSLQDMSDVLELAAGGRTICTESGDEWTDHFVADAAPVHAELAAIAQRAEQRS